MSEDKYEPRKRLMGMGEVAYEDYVFDNRVLVRSWT